MSEMTYERPAPRLEMAEAAPEKVAVNGDGVAAEETQAAPEKAVTVRLNVKPVEVRLDLDLSKLTWRDVMELQKMGNDDQRADEVAERMTQILSKVVGQDVEELPAAIVNDVMQYVMKQVGQESLANPKN